MRGDDIESALAAELDGHYFEDLAVGMTDVYSRTVTESDVVPFCGISGGTNPLRLEREYAARARFGGTIAHGMLSASLISTVLDAELPGPGAIYVGRNRRFRAPVRVGDTAVARATVTELAPARSQARLETTCRVDGKAAIDGEALLMVPSRA